MAFNFNWSPLSTNSTSSSAFYDHAKSLLTAALNKSAKPPIIVDDILVDDLDLGASAPDLEILEIGDIAEDRFRGIFRMSYSGDACLTLRTKVQVCHYIPVMCCVKLIRRAKKNKANPLNTYLSTTPSFTSPSPLAASSPLTIPVQITLSCFKLSGFVILVFSKAKGITLVFRNDPLESLKVSSTFDSIPFIAEYLQKEIERQVRRIFQEDLPVAVHRLSLRLWNPEYAASLDEEATAPSKPLRFEHSSDDEAGDESDDEQFVNPLLTPADNSDAPSATFSQKSLLGLSSLVDSQKTLSLDTPTISDAVFRAWASGANQAPTTMWDRPGALDVSPATPGEKPYTFSDPADVIESQSAAAGSVRSTLITSPSRHSTPAGAPGRRRKKHRVVDLRNARNEKPAEPLSEPSSSADPTPDPSTVAPSECAVEDVFCDRSSAAIHHAREDSIDYDSDSKPTLLPSPLPQSAPLASPPSPPPPPPQQQQRPASPADSVATADVTYPPPPPPPPRVSTPAPAPARAAAPAAAPVPAPAEKEKEALRAREARRDRQSKIRMPPGVQGSILEQAILSKIMVEIQRSLEEERLKRSNVQTKWGVERELENLCGTDELPAYRAN